MREAGEDHREATAGLCPGLPQLATVIAIISSGATAVFRSSSRSCTRITASHYGKPPSSGCTGFLEHPPVQREIVIALEQVFGEETVLPG
jgi:hypothetical protein